MKPKLLSLLLSLMVFPGLLYAANPDNPKTVDATIVNEPTVHVGSDVDVNIVNIPAVDATIVNEPTIHVGSDVDVNAYQAGDWSVNVETMAKTIKTFTGNVQSTDGWVQVYQIPSGKRFVLTDIFFNQRIHGSFTNAITLKRNSSGRECNIGSTALMQTHTSGPDGSEPRHANRQVFYPLSTGYEFGEGERICVGQSGGGLIFYNLSGYETDM